MQKCKGCCFRRPKLPKCFKPCPGSPFHVGIKNPVNPEKVQCYGPGLDSRQVKAGKPATFTVDTTEAGEAPLDVKFTDSTGKYIYSDELNANYGIIFVC